MFVNIIQRKKYNIHFCVSNLDFFKKLTIMSRNTAKKPPKKVSQPPNSLFFGQNQFDWQINWLNTYNDYRQEAATRIQNARAESEALKNYYAVERQNLIKKIDEQTHRNEAIKGKFKVFKDSFYGKLDKVNERSRNRYSEIKKLRLELEQERKKTLNLKRNVTKSWYLWIMCETYIHMLNILTKSNADHERCTNVNIVHSKHKKEAHL